MKRFWEMGRTFYGSLRLWVVISALTFPGGNSCEKWNGRSSAQCGRIVGY